MKPRGGSHELFCKKNPNRRSLGGKNNPNFGNKGKNQYSHGAKMSIETRNKISDAHRGNTLSEEHKEKISKGMKIAHKEGKAWNIGQSRWNNEQSYPEKFFEKVINNEFDDKNYETEHPVGIYSIDFAWPDKKLAIEIDGDQHKRFEEIIERDKRKDAYLESLGWKVLRIDWKSMFNEPKQYIKIANEFIHSDEA